MRWYIDLKMATRIIAVLMIGIFIYLSGIALVQLSNTFLYNISNPFIRWGILVGMFIGMIFAAFVLSLFSPYLLIAAVILVVIFGFTPNTILFISFSILSFIFGCFDDD